MSMGIPNHGQDPDESHYVLINLWVGSRPPIGDPNLILQSHLDDRNDREEKHKLRLQELEELPARHLKAQQQIELYHACFSAAYNKKVKTRTFKKGNLVLPVRRPMILTYKAKDKFHPKWEGLIVVKSVYLNGAYRLITTEDNTLMMPINGKFLKRYYP